MPEFEGGFIPLQGKNKERKKKKKRRIAEVQRSLFDLILSWEYFSSASQTGKQNKTKHYSKEGRIGHRPLALFLSPWPWLGNMFPYPHSRSFPMAKRGWTLYTHRQGREGLEWHHRHLAPFLSIGSAARNYDNKCGKYYVTGMFDNLSFLLFEMTAFALRSHGISRSFSSARHRVFWFYTSPLVQ